MAVDSKMAAAYEMQVAVGDVAQAMAVLGQTREEEEESTYSRNGGDQWLFMDSAAAAAAKYKYHTCQPSLFRWDSPTLTD